MPINRNAMERTAVRSRDIAIIGYDPATSTLEVAFRSGTVYHYLSVPEEVYQKLMTAPSHGIYFNEHIKENYLYKRVSYAEK